MRILGIGVDIVEVERIEALLSRHGARFAHRVFTPAEQEYCAPQRGRAKCYAARFAAKEAVSKALGCGIGARLGWLEIEVRREVAGRPYVVLSGEGARYAGELGIHELHLSLSHSEHYAVAHVIATDHRP